MTEQLQITEEELQWLITANKVKRSYNAVEGFQKALHDNNCVLHTVIEFSSDGNIISVNYKVVPL